MCGKQFWENICRVRTALYGSCRSYCQESPQRPLHLQQRMLCYIMMPRGEMFKPWLHTQEKTMTGQNKNLFCLDYHLKNRDQLHIMNQYAMQKNKSDFPGRSHWTLLPGGSRDLRVSCRRRMHASAVVRARWKTGEGWGLLFCGCQFGGVGGDGVLQLFLGQGIKALHHTVCRQTGFWVMVPALGYRCTQKMHALWDNNIEYN